MTLTKYPYKKINIGSIVFSGFSFKSKNLQTLKGIPIIKIKNIQNRNISIHNYELIYEELVTDNYKTSTALIKAEEFEKKLLKNIFRFHIYRETIYEAADRIDLKLDEYKIRDLLLGYGTHDNITDIDPLSLLNKLNDTSLP